MDNVLIITFDLQKTPLKNEEVKKKKTGWEYSQVTDLTKNLYLDYIKNSCNYNITLNMCSLLHVDYTQKLYKTIRQKTIKTKDLVDT